MRAAIAIIALAASLVATSPTAAVDPQPPIPSNLPRPGTLVCEIAPHQAEHLIEVAHQCGYAEVEVRPDLSARPRVLMARYRANLT